MENLSFYNGSILAGAVTTAVLALCLILVKPPQTKTFDVYRRSKIILGMGYAVYAIGISAFIAYPFRAEMPNVATAINLTYYFAAAFLFGCSFISLLSPSFCSTERIKRYVITYFTYVILLWTVTLSLPSGLCPAIHIAFGGWFVIQALILIRVFLRSYRQLRRQLDNEYADATATFIEWLHKSAWCVIVFGILCGVFTFLPKICIASLMATGIFVFIYIYIFPCRTMPCISPRCNTWRRILLKNRLSRNLTVSWWIRSNNGSPTADTATNISPSRVSPDISAPTAHTYHRISTHDTVAVSAHGSTVCVWSSRAPSLWRSRHSLSPTFPGNVDFPPHHTSANYSKMTPARHQLNINGHFLTNDLNVIPPCRSPFSTNILWKYTR